MSASGHDPVLGQDWKTRKLALYDPLTLERVPGRTVDAGLFTGAWAWDAARVRLALARYDSPQLRLVDGERMRRLGDVRLLDSSFGGVEAVTWVGPDRLLALVRREVVATGVGFVLVDATRRKVVRTVSLRGAPYGAELTGRGLAVLLGPQRGIGPARIAVSSPNGSVRSASLPGVSVGRRTTGDGVDTRVRSVIPGFATNPSGTLAVAVTASSRAVAVDLRTLELTTHQLSTRTPQAVEKTIEGPERYAAWVDGVLVAVGGYDWSLAADNRTAVRAAGVRLVDTRTWTWRTLDAEAATFSVAPAAGLVLTYGGSWGPSGGTYTGVRAYGLDGTLRWSLFDGQDAVAPVHGQYAYVHRNVGANRPQLMDVVDPATGTILGSREWPDGQAPPRLLVRDADTG